MFSRLLLFRRKFSSFACKPDRTYLSLYKLVYSQNCPGCGAKFQEDEPKSPGYLKKLVETQARHIEKVNDFLHKDSIMAKSSALTDELEIEHALDLFNYNEESDNQSKSISERPSTDDERIPLKREGCKSRPMKSFFYPYSKERGIEWSQNEIEKDRLNRRFSIPYGLVTKIDPTKPLEPQITSLATPQEGLEKALEDSVTIFDEKVNLADAYPEDEPKEADPKHIVSLVCQRCRNLKYSGVSETTRAEIETWTPEFRQYLRSKLTERALIVIIVDVVDFPVSFIPNFYGIFPLDARIILVGNKIDLLPRNVEFEKVRHALKGAATKAGLSNILKTLMISAKKGTNIEELGDLIYKFGSSKANQNHDVFLVGCTNSGKTSVWNNLIKRFKVENRPLATESLEPCTTVAISRVEIEHFKSSKKSFSADPRDIKPYGFLCDTPGIVNPCSSFRFLTLPEIKIVSPNREIKPLSWRLRPGESIFVGGLYRIDYVKGKQPIVVTFCLKTFVPYHVTSLAEADSEYANNVAMKDDILNPPTGGILRMATFPALKKTIEGLVCNPKRIYNAEIDYLLSGMGWFNVTGQNLSEPAVLDIWSPDGIGIGQRDSIYPGAPTQGCKGGLYGGVRAAYHSRNKHPKVVFKRAIALIRKERRKDFALTKVENRRLLSEVLAKIRKDPENLKNHTPQEISDLAYEMFMAAQGERQEQ